MLKLSKISLVVLGVGACAAVVCFALSLLVVRAHRHGWYRITFGHGCIEIKHEKRYLAEALSMFPEFSDTTTGHIQWMPICKILPAEERHIALPLWIPSVMLCGLTPLMAAIRRRKRPAGICNTCLYSLKELPSPNVCPECGTRSQ